MSTAYPILILPSRKYLRECFVYDRCTGELRWKRRPQNHFKTKNRWAGWNTVYSGTIAGTINNHGYHHALIRGRHYHLHRIIWKLVLGMEPPEFLDHIDGNRSNNRFENLRPATRKEQSWNSCLYKNNQSGRRGVEKRGNKWIARIRIDGVIHYLGTFNTISAAAAAYEHTARKVQGEFYRE
jgi:hypothetical protein